MGASPVCAAFTTYEGAVSNSINAALHAHESEKDMEFYKGCLKDLEEAKAHLRQTYAEREGAVSRTEKARQAKEKRWPTPHQS